MNGAKSKMCIAACTIAVIILVSTLNYLHRMSVSMIPKPITQQTMTASSTMKLESSAFNNGEAIPVEYTCDGKEESPDFMISGVPTGAQSLALVMEDPDAPIGTFVHWVVYNIPPSTQTVAPEMHNTSPTFGIGGKNSSGTTGYIGPCPPSGTHRYEFHLYALDTTLNPHEPPDATGLRRLMDGHILSETTLTAIYSRIKSD